ncbi:MAG: ABC transporter permease, partial [Burkholderiales bacterium]
LPLIAPGVIAGALMAFTLSIDDFVITFFTAGPDSRTLPLVIYTMVKITVTPEINAVSTLLMLLTLFLIVIATRLVPGVFKAR